VRTGVRIGEDRGHAVQRIQARRATRSAKAYPGSPPRLTTRFTLEAYPFRLTQKNACGHANIVLQRLHVRPSRIPGGRQHANSRLRVWPVSGLAASYASPSRPDSPDSGFENACAAQQNGFRRSRSLTVAGTAQVERKNALPVSRLTAHANACAGTKRAHTIAHGAPPDKRSRPVRP
jgi:hypothetical protein